MTTVTPDELLDTAETVITAAQTHRAGDVLRAAELARKWLESTESLDPKRATPFRCFVLGYLAAVKDRT